MKCQNEIVALNHLAEKENHYIVQLVHSAKMNLMLLHKILW